MRPYTEAEQALLKEGLQWVIGRCTEERALAKERQKAEDLKQFEEKEALAWSLYEELTNATPVTTTTKSVPHPPIQELEVPTTILAR